MTQKMHGLLERILEANKRRVFHYSSYWGTWSRILAHPQGIGGVVDRDIIEVNLTAINPEDASGWEDRVKPIVFRAHGTAPDRNDRHELRLPESTVLQMQYHLGTELALRLLQEDFLQIIDLEKVRAYNPRGGGRCLREVLKDG